MKHESNHDTVDILNTEIAELLTKMDVDCRYIVDLQKDLAESKSEIASLKLRLSELEEQSKCHNRWKVEIIEERDSMLTQINIQLKEAFAQLKTAERQKDSYKGINQTLKDQLDVMQVNMDRIQTELLQLKSMLQQKNKEIQFLEGLSKHNKEQYNSRLDQEDISNFTSERIVTGNFEHKRNRNTSDKDHQVVKLERRVNLLRLENSYLKKKVLRGINQFLVQEENIMGDGSAMDSMSCISEKEKTTKSVYSIEGSYQTTTTDKSDSMYVSINSQDMDSIKGSFVERSSTFRGVTFHVVAQKNIKDEAHNSNYQSKKFDSKHSL